LKILPRLKSANYSIRLFPLRRGGQLENEFTESGIKICNSNIKYLGLRGRFKSIFNLCYTLLQEKPDIIHYFLPAAYIIGTICSIFSLKSIRLMSRRSLNNYQAKRPILKFIEYKIHNFMCLIIGNSKAIIKQLQGESIELEKLRLIYNGLNIPEMVNENLRNKARTNLSLKNNALVFTVVANLIPYKGHKDLFFALKNIVESLPKEWILFCIGRDDRYKNKLSELTIKLNLQEHIKFIRHTRSIENYLYASDIGILPSHQEGFSNSLLEGMACGLPMIATNVGGNPEAIINNENGFIVPPNDPNRLGEKILDLAMNKGLREKFGKNSYNYVKKNFSIDRCVNKYIDVYKSLIQTR